MNPESSQSLCENFFLEISVIYENYSQENQEIFQKFSSRISACLEKIFDVLKSLDKEGKNSENVCLGVIEMGMYVTAMGERMNQALDESFLEPENQ